MKTILTRPCLLLAVLLPLPCCGGDAPVDGVRAETRAQATTDGKAVVAEGLRRAALQPWQRELLLIAFEAASRFPMEPHWKNRGRAQDVVVAACFELGEPELARSYGERIGDWRRGTSLADFVWFQARAGVRDGLEEVLGEAQRVLDAERKSPDAQEWRGDMVALKLARAWTELGQPEKATAAVAGIAPESANAVDGTWASTLADRVARMSAADAKLEVAAIDANYMSMSIGQQAAAGELLAAMHERFFADAALRAEIEKRPARLWTTLMPNVRLDSLVKMLRTNVARGESARGKELRNVVAELVEGHTWREEDELPWRAVVVELTALVGEVDRARALADAALARFHEVRERIVNIYRARALRPLMLARFALGDRQRAGELLELVLEEGMENPNSRPRCDDLVDTCTQLAVRGFEPPATSLVRIREIAAGLGDPW
ncbi:MAG: hypothetical protein JNL12_19705 [Planctomycetes bacterium]|nr:hypothetical protein [Planctomycetota bacterium]